MSNQKRLGAGEIAKILFVCEYNACRSQMAEGLARHLFPKTVSAQSAGLYPGEVHRLTVEIMREIGIDISSHRSKQLKEIAGKKFDLAVVLAEPALEPVLALGAKRTILMTVPDPAAPPGTLETLQKRLRSCRDDLRSRLSNLEELTRTENGRI